MIAAAVQKTTPWWQNLSFSFGWFDVVLVAVLAFGIWRGRKRGMSREGLPTTMWLAAVIGGGFGYQPLGEILLKSGYVRQVFGTSVNERTASFVIAYLAITFAAFLIYSLLAKFFKEKLAGSNTFGSGEYYLGMIAGMVRYACLLLFILALMNAPYYSAAEIAATKAYNNRWYGGGMKDYNGEFIPSFDQIQANVFVDSRTGAAIKKYLSVFLISGTDQVPAKKPAAATSN